MRFVPSATREKVNWSRPDSDTSQENRCLAISAYRKVMLKELRRTHTPPINSSGLNKRSAFRSRRCPASLVTIRIETSVAANSSLWIGVSNAINETTVGNVNEVAT